MYGIVFKLCIVFSIVSPSLTVQKNYRKYNVDDESHKMYGEDFKSVLKRFRRTPDYLKILQDKLGDLKTSAREMSLQVLHYYHGKLLERVNKEIPTNTTVAPEEKKYDIDKTYVRFHRNRRQGEPTTEVVENSLQKIHNLDNYKVFDSQLSVVERNSLKDLGFEFAGKIVHSIIENMDPNPEKVTTTEKEQQVTHIAVEENKTNEITTTTTTHPPEHAGNNKEDDANIVTEEVSPITEDSLLDVPMMRQDKASVPPWLRN